MKIGEFSSIGHLNTSLKSAECVVGRFGGVRIRCLLASGKSILTTRNTLTKIAEQLMCEPTVIEFRYTVCAETVDRLKTLHAFRVDGRAIFTRIRQFFGNFRFKREAVLKSLESKLQSFEIDRLQQPIGGAAYLRIVNGFLSRNLPEKALEAASLIPKEGFLGIALAAYTEIARSYSQRFQQDEAERVLNYFRRGFCI